MFSSTMLLLHMLSVTVRVRILYFPSIFRNVCVSQIRSVSLTCFLILSPSFPTPLFVFLLYLLIDVERRAVHMNISGPFDCLKIYWAKMPRPEYREVAPGYKGSL